MLPPEILNFISPECRFTCDLRVMLKTTKILVIVTKSPNFRGDKDCNGGRGGGNFDSSQEQLPIQLYS